MPPLLASQRKPEEAANVAKIFGGPVSNFPEKLNRTLPTDPYLSCWSYDKNTGLGIRSVGPVGAFLDNFNRPLLET